MRAFLLTVPDPEGPTVATEPWAVAVTDEANCHIAPFPDGPPAAAWAVLLPSRRPTWDHLLHALEATNGISAGQFELDLDGIPLPSASVADVAWWLVMRWASQRSPS